MEPTGRLSVDYVVNPGTGFCYRPGEFWILSARGFAILRVLFPRDGSYGIIYSWREKDMNSGIFGGRYGWKLRFGIMEIVLGSMRVKLLQTGTTMDRDVLNEPFTSRSD